MSENNFEVKYVDTEKNVVAELKGKDIADQLEKIKKAINLMLKKMEKVGDYELTEFTATVGVEAGVVVFKATGEIAMTWKKPKSKGEVSY
jgi:hypothetical protein